MNYKKETHENPLNKIKIIIWQTSIHLIRRHIINAFLKKQSVQTMDELKYAASDG